MSEELMLLQIDMPYANLTEMPPTLISLTERHQRLWPLLHALVLGGKCLEVK